MKVSEDMKISPAILPSEGVAGTDDTINGATLDMQGFESFMAMLVFGVITATAVTTISVQQGDESDLSDATDLEASAQSVAADDDDETYYTEIIKPTKRYVRVNVTRATANCVIAAANYIQFGARHKPVTHATGVTGESHVSPAEGTA